MIKSFRDEETRLVFLGYQSKKFPPVLQRKMRVKLRYIYSANELDDLRVPAGNHLEKLTGEREGQHSIRVNKQWRICFTWDNGAHDVEISNHYKS
jgi:proteic killer suppression protein